MSFLHYGTKKCGSNRGVKLRTHSSRASCGRKVTRVRQKSKHILLAGTKHTSAGGSRADVARAYRNAFGVIFDA